MVNMDPYDHYSEDDYTYRDYTRTPLTPRSETVTKSVHTPAPKEKTLGMALGGWLTAVGVWFTILAGVVFGVVYIVEAWKYWNWQLALLLSLGAVSVVVGSIYYAMDQE